MRTGGVAVEDGRIVAVGPARRARRASAAPSRTPSSSPPSSTRTRTSSTPSTRASATASLPALDRPARHAQAPAPDGDAVAIARLGAAECLRSGIATIGGRAVHRRGRAVRAPSSGSRGTVYLEVFGDDPEAALERSRRCERLRRRLASGRSCAGVSPHAPYTTSAAVYEACAGLGVPVRRIWPRARPSRIGSCTATGTMTAAAADLLVEPAGRSGIRMLAERGLLGPGLVAAHCVYADGRRSGSWPSTARRSRTARGRTRSSAAARRPSPALRERRPGRPRHRQPGLDALVRHVRGDEDGRRAPPAPASAARTPSRPKTALELATLGAATRSGSGTRRARSPREARRPRGRLARRLPVPPLGGANDRRGLRRLARQGAPDPRRRRGSVRGRRIRWHEVRRSASAARARLLSSVPPRPKT